MAMYVSMSTHSFLCFFEVDFWSLEHAAAYPQQHSDLTHRSMQFCLYCNITAQIVFVVLGNSSTKTQCFCLHVFFLFHVVTLYPLPANAMFEVLQHPSGTYVPGWHCHCYQFALWLRVPLRWLPPCETVRTGYPGFLEKGGVFLYLNGN